MVRPGSPAPLWGAAGKAGYALSCVAAALVLAISGFSYFVVKAVGSIGGSHAIVSGPSIGAQNILLMGLESRTDWQGNILPDDVLKALHACNRQEIQAGCGGNATNTLILIHIPAGGKKAVGFSIPRDDWVTFANTLGNQQVGKIDQAYGVSMATKENQLAGQGLSQTQIAFEGNEAGRAAAVATVEQLTGVHVDHFAEINLDGFYELAKVLGGVEVCLNHPVPYDPNSGFSAAHAGYQHLNAKKALAFVRQRDGLTNGDLDRTHRQQAFLDSVIHQMRTEGILGDLGKIQGLLSVAKQYVITDSGWNLLDFITQMRSLTAGNLRFYTLPIVGYETIAGQKANEVNPAYIQQLVQETFYPPHRSSHRSSHPQPTVSVNPSLTTVDVLNGGNTAGLAGQVSSALVSVGYTAGKVGNTAPLATTQVLYGSGSAAAASKIAALFNVTATASSTVAAGHVEVMLGADSTTVPNVSATPTSSPSSSPSPLPTTGPQGGAVTATNGIPCVN